ncbi:MAG: OmpA family protein [Pseudomonadota bacterium]
MNSAHSDRNEPAESRSSSSAQHTQKKIHRFSLRDLTESFFSIVFAVSSLVVIILGGWSENHFLSKFDISFSQYADLTDYARVALKNFFNSLYVLLIIAAIAVLFAATVLISIGFFVFLTSVVRRLTGNHHIFSTFKSVSVWINNQSLIKKGYNLAYSATPFLLVIGLISAAYIVHLEKNNSYTEIVTCIAQINNGQMCDHERRGFFDEKAHAWLKDYPLVTVHLSSNRTTKLVRESKSPDASLAEGTATNMIRLGKAGDTTLFFDVEQEKPVIIPHSRILSLVFWPESTEENRFSPNNRGGKIADLMQDVEKVSIRIDYLESNAEELHELLELWKGDKATIGSVAADVGEVQAGIAAVKEALSGFGDKQVEILDLTTKLRLDIAGKPEECLDEEAITSVYFRRGSPTTTDPDRYAAGEQQKDEVIKEELVKVINEIDPNPDRKQVIALIGYADFTGHRARNFELSYRRANLLTNYLVRQAQASGKQINRKNIRILGTGEIFSVASDDENADEDFLSRRVDLYVCDI